MYTLYSDNSSLKGRGLQKGQDFRLNLFTEKQLILVLQDSFFFLNHEILEGNQDNRKKDHSHPYKINGKEMFIHNDKRKENC